MATVLKLTNYRSYSWSEQPQKITVTFYFTVGNLALFSVLGMGFQATFYILSKVTDFCVIYLTSDVI